MWAFKSRNIKVKSKNYSKNILISCLSTIVPTAKFESLISYYLLKKGYKVHILLKNKNKLIEDIFLSFGHVEIIYLENYFPDNSEIYNQAESILSNNLDDFINFKFNNVKIGKNTLSKVVRHFRIGEIDKNNTQHLSYLKELIIDSLKTIHAFNSIISINNFEKALFSEKGYTPSGEIFDLCIYNNIDVIQWISSPTPESFSFKRYNKKNYAMHPLSISNYTFDKLFKLNEIDYNLITKYISELYANDGTYNYQELNKGKEIVQTKDSLAELLGFVNNKKICVIFCHILYDATFFYGESIYSNYQEWLIETVRIAIKNNNINWIIKVHPVNVWRSKMDGVVMEQLEKVILEKEFGILPSNIKFINADTKINTFSFFNYIDFGITVRGTIGMELPCFDVPVITCGSGRYDKMGFTVDLNTKENYENLLLNLHNFNVENIKDMSDKAKLYTYITLKLRAIKFDHIKLNYTNENIFSKNKTFKLKVNNKFYKNIDINLMSVVDWIDIQKDEEYISFTL